MSRIIVKNLPNKIADKKLKNVFSAHGNVTDVQLKFTPEGKFRNFAFVGFQTEEQAKTAQNALDKTYINTSQISVEMCAPLDGTSKPRPWSKHSKGSSMHKLKHEPEEPPKEKKRKKTKEEKVVELLKKHKGDDLFQEFMEVHLPDKKELWQATSDDDEKKYEDEEEDKNLKAADKTISDLDYLKMKKSKSAEVTEEPSSRPVLMDRLTVKISNLPYTVKRPDVKEFIQPAKPKAIRIPVKMKGVAYCDFETESEVKKALTRNRSFMGSRRILVRSVNKEKIEEIQKSTKKRTMEERRLGEAETVADSGRLFLRNLAYTVMEDDLRPIFEKYGPITELNIPIDPISRKSKGFGFVTYMIPENACKALNEMDGSVVHGRLLHILPGIVKEDPDDDDDAGLSWKEKKLKKMKKQASNKINWNTFFINENCLAEAMAEKYNTTKGNVLSDERAGVRLALGETEMVQSTKDFLVQNGVLLTSFENMGDAKRSETVILVKNLPHKTEENEIREKFEPFGLLNNVLLTPYGGTCIVEFIEPSEARKAFKRLAYSKFKHIPLYLEWAPKTIFDGRNAPKVEEPVEPKKKDLDGRVPEEGATLYVKGINFSTNSEALRKHFEQCGEVSSAIVAEKLDPKNPGQKLSMGYGFVEFYDKTDADAALKTLQFSSLDDHKIELKRSNRTTHESAAREKTSKKGKPSAKLVVRNVPFQATERELRELFKVFGEIKSCRLPKKMVGTGSHRGFCFIEYHTKQDAKKAFAALSESTHLYGRRLVLEWAATDDDDVETLRLKTAQQFGSSGRSNKKVTLDDTPQEDADE